MTTEQIELAFKAALEEKAIYNELTGISEDKIYNWRKGRGAKPTIGDMLNVLYQLKKVTILVNKNLEEKDPSLKYFVEREKSVYERAEQQIKNAFSEEEGYLHKFTFDPNKK